MTIRDWVAAPRAVPLLLFALVWLSGAWFGSWEFNPNNSTRLFAAISLVEAGDATIDEFADATIDKAQFGAHFYLDKAPGMTLMALPTSWAAERISGTRSASITKMVGNPSFAAFLKLRLRLATMFGAALLTALAAVALWSLASDMAGDARAGMIAAIGYALATPIWGWSTTMFGHAVVAALFVIAVWAIWQGSKTSRAWPLAMLAGAALGWAVVVEFQSVVAGAAIGGWALWRLRALPMRDRSRLIAAAIIGGVAAGLPLIAYNLIAFGTPIKLGYQGVVGFEGMQQGLFGITYPKPDIALALLFGVRRGLFWVAPILIVAPIGLALMVRDPRLRDLGWLAITVAVVELMINAAYAYWDGGYSTGPRHLVPAIPFLALGLAPLWVALGTMRARVMVGGLLGLSVLLNLIIAATDINAPDTAPFPLWRPIIAEDLANGRFRDLPSEFWGWLPGQGMAAYLVLAVVLVKLLAAALHAKSTSNRRAHLARPAA